MRHITLALFDLRPNFCLVKESNVTRRFAFHSSCVSITVFFLCACHRSSNESKALADGALIYASTCARCHGADGCGGLVVGSASRARNFCDSGFQRSTSDVQLKSIISQGKGMMPAFGDDYSEEQLTALVRQIRKFGSGR